MNKLKYFIACVLLLFISSMSFAGSSLNIYQSYKHGDQFREFDALMNECKFETSNNEKLKSRIVKLQKVTEEKYHYPARGIALFFLGKHLSQDSQFKAALDAYDNALAVLPELAKASPVETLYAQTYEKWNNERIPQYAWCVILASLVVTIPFVFSKAFIREFSFKKLLPIVVVLVVWGMTVLIVGAINTAEVPELLVKNFEGPHLVKSNIYDDGSERLISLFVYGTYAVLGACLISLALSSIKKTFVRMSYSAICSLVFSAAVMVLYFMNVCNKDTESTGDSVLSYKLNFMNKMILWHHEVPEEMFSMYDEELQQEILKAYKKRDAEKK